VGVFVKSRGLAPLSRPVRSIGAVAVALSRVDSEGRGGAEDCRRSRWTGRSAVLWPPCAPIAALFMHLAARWLIPALFVRQIVAFVQLCLVVGILILGYSNMFVFIW